MHTNKCNAPHETDYSRICKICQGLRILGSNVTHAAVGSWHAGSLSIDRTLSSVEASITINPHLAWQSSKRCVRRRTHRIFPAHPSPLAPRVKMLPRSKRARSGSATFAAPIPHGRRCAPAIPLRYWPDAVPMVGERGTASLVCQVKLR